MNKTIFGNPFIIAKREVSSFIFSPVAYIVLFFFMIFSGVVFFYYYFSSGEASLRGYFELLPWLLSVFVPALTMRFFSEEWSTGSIEMLLTSPFTLWEIIIGKYSAAVFLSVLMLIPSILYLITVSLTGEIDFGVTFGGYLGAFFLCALYSAVGIFISAVTASQVISLIVSIAVCFFFYFIYFVLQFIPGQIANILQFISTGYHFKNFAKGIIDSREILYFISMSVLFLFSAKTGIDKRR
ncbi:MAG: ABC transporter permease subunit [Spirochaetes bacterium]|nr:ABC transporter permease subunit [Spirochaetota bacterium]